MDLNKLKYVYMLGAGGIGMSALARYFNALGKVVAGYDRTSTELTDELISENIAVSFIDEVETMPSFIHDAGNDELLIIYTPAIPADNKIFVFLKNNFTLYKRSQVLGFITKSTRTIAVAGTHGKTTTSTLIAHMLHACGANCSAFLGGISKNFNSNLLLGNANAPDHVAVVEADEFDRSFLTLFPHTAIVTSVDADHLDIYETHEKLIESYNQFSNQIDKDGVLVEKAGLNLKTTAGTVREYAIDRHANYSAQNISIVNHEYVFDFESPVRRIENLRLGIPGRHNVENCVAALSALLDYNFSDTQLRNALATYSGVKRRFDYQIKSSEIVMIDDYAHHPEELRAVISSVKELYAGKKLTVVFQPHLFSRTKDFADEFAQSLSLADLVYLLPVYPAREKPIEGVSSKLIFDKIETQKVLCEFRNLTKELNNENHEVVLTLGAGDIDTLVEPVSEMLKMKYKLISSN